MGLSPNPGEECGLRPSRAPRSRPNPASRTSSTGSSDDHPAPGCSTVSHTDSVPSNSRLSLAEELSPLQHPVPPPASVIQKFIEGEPGARQGSRPELPTQLCIAQGAGSNSSVTICISQGREKPEVNLETTPSQKTTELNSTPKSESEGRFVKQEGKPRPRPGDLIEIFRIGYEHWAIYVEDDCVVHLAPPSEEFEAGSITSVFSNRAVVKYSRLEDVLHGCSWKINNKLDGTYLPLPVDKIIQRTKKMVNKIVQYSLIEGNCEHFVNGLRYGVPRSQQVEHALMEGAKAAGAVISAVVDSIKPKSVTA